MKNSSINKKYLISFGVISLFLILLPVMAEVLYNYILEYSKTTFTIYWRHAFLYGLVVLLGISLPLHVFFFKKSAAKKLVLLVLLSILIVELVWIFFIGFYGAILACFLCVFTLMELLLKE